MRIYVKLLALTSLVLSIGANAGVIERRIIKITNKSVAALEKRISDTDHSIPDLLLEKAECVAVFPSVKKAGFGIGGWYGKGLVSCRDGAGNFNAPAMLSFGGGSYGFQIGVQIVEHIVVFTNPKAIENFTNLGIKLGAAAGLSIGPEGRNADIGIAINDETIKSGVFSYSRSKGLYAGISLEGGVINKRDGDNDYLYQTVNTQSILRMTTSPSAVNAFQDTLNRNFSR